MVHKATDIPLHGGLPPADELPWTINYVIKKRAQVDSFSELPSDKRPPDDIVWYGTPEDLDAWFDKVFDKKAAKPGQEVVLDIRDDEIG